MKHQSSLLIGVLVTVILAACSGSTTPVSTLPPTTAPTANPLPTEPPIPGPHWQVVTASSDNTARVWDAISGQTIAILQGHTGPVVSAVFSPDGNWVATASNDKTARVWEAATGKNVAVLSGHTTPVLTLAFSPDGKMVVTGAGGGTAI